MSIVLTSLMWVMAGLARLLGLVAFDRWDHKRRHSRPRLSAGSTRPV
jgi:hypothetical protein